MFVISKFEIKIEFMDQFGEKRFKNFTTLDNFFKQVRRRKYGLDLFLDKVFIDYENKKSIIKDITVEELIVDIKNKNSLL